MYAIVGITGKVGSAAAKILLQNNVPVKAIIRNPAKAEEWKAQGAEIAIAELYDAKALEFAFKGTEGVFIMTPPLFDSNRPMEDHDQMLTALTTAIENSRPKKVVYLSSIGAQHVEGTGAIKKLHDMEQAFHKLSVPTAGIRAGWFIENFIGGIAYARKTGQLLSFINPTDYAIPMVATKDIGNLAARLLTENWSGHRTLELSGPSLYSANDVAKVLSDYAKTAVNALPIPEDNYQTTYQSFGFTLETSALMAEMNQGFNRKWIVFEKNGMEQVSGDTLLEDTIKEYIND